MRPNCIFVGDVRITPLKPNENIGELYKLSFHVPFTYTDPLDAFRFCEVTKEGDFYDFFSYKRRCYVAFFKQSVLIFQANENNTAGEFWARLERVGGIDGK